MLTGALGSVFGAGALGLRGAGCGGGATSTGDEGAAGRLSPAVAAEGPRSPATVLLAGWAPTWPGVAGVVAGGLVSGGA